MKNLNIYRHGELILKETTLPEGAKKIEQTKETILSHSETGHHHVLTSAKPFEIYECNGQKYVMTMQVAELTHKKTGKDVHKTHKLVPAVYQIILKKEFDYFEGVMKTVRD